MNISLKSDKIRTNVKQDIHPKIYKDAKIICACGNVLTTATTIPEVHIEVCSKCHPFFTGKQKLVDAAGMVDKFKKRYAKTKEKKEANKARQAERDVKKGGQDSVVTPENKSQA